METDVVEARSCSSMENKADELKMAPDTKHDSPPNTRPNNKVEMLINNADSVTESTDQRLHSKVDNKAAKRISTIPDNMNDAGNILDGKAKNKRDASLIVLNGDERYEDIQPPFKKLHRRPEEVLTRRSLKDILLNQIAEKHIPRLSSGTHEVKSAKF